MELLNNWGLSLERDPTKMQARLLPEERIIFGRNKDAPAGPQADFSRAATSSEMLEPKDISDWAMVFWNRDEKTAHGFEDLLLKVCGPLGMRISKARRISLQNDRNDTYVSEIRKECNAHPNIQIIVIFFPSLRDDRYAAVKQILCADMPVPSQCINSKTLRNDAKNRSIVLKIALQMNCKLGGTLWGVKIPMEKTMICGIDTYHGKTGVTSINVGAFVGSLNSEFTKWHSKPVIQGKQEELISGLTACFESALTAYKKANNCYPERIIIYRDGVGDGQLNVVKSFECPQFREACRKVDPTYSPMFTFVIVQKRINTKFFKVTGEGIKCFENPPPGSILDNTITRRFLYDFYLVSQHVREGTTNPSHFIILEDDNNFKPDILQRLTYKLTFLYYNWPGKLHNLLVELMTSHFCLFTGTVRVPAPCQYAHKLADLVGESIRKQVSEKLLNQLFYL